MIIGGLKKPSRENDRGLCQWGILEGCGSECKKVRLRKDAPTPGSEYFVGVVGSRVPRRGPREKTSENLEQLKQRPGDAASERSI